MSETEESPRKRQKKSSKEKKHKHKHKHKRRRYSTSSSESSDEEERRRAKLWRREEKEKRQAVVPAAAVYLEELEGSDADIAQVAAELREEEQLERKALREEEEARAGQKGDKFQALISSLKKDQVPHGDYDAPLPAAPASSSSKNNFSAAALLRARLQGGGQPAAPALQPSATSENLEESLEVRKEIAILRAQNNLRASSDKKTSSTNNNNKNTAKDSSSLSLRELMASEKYSKDEDLDAVYASNVMRLGGHFKGNDLSSDKAGLDEEAPINMKMYERKDVDPVDSMKRRAQAVLKDRQQHVKATENCSLCLNSKRFDSSLLLSKGNHVLLRLKAAPYNLHDWHMEIIPLDHRNSLLQCDEETAVEVDRYKTCIQRFYETLGLNMVVLETAVHFNRRPHALLEVVPLARGLEAELSMFFREAFLSCDEEWSQHRKILPTNAQKPLARALPSHFPYLYAEWHLCEHDDDGSWEGLAHAVEQDEQIQAQFCYDVLAGLLEEDNHKMRRGKAVSRNEEDRRLRRAKEEWTPFDWTQYLADIQATENEPAK